MDIEQLDEFLLVGSAVTLAAILAVRLSSRAGLPSLLIYLLMGVALGEAGLGIPFEDAALAHALGFAALAVILAEGGLTTSWRDARPSMPLGLSLATIGVAVSVTVVALGAHYLLGLPWTIAILLGAVTSPTDAAAVFSVLRVVPLPQRLVGSLEAESGLNDAPTVVLVTLVSTGAVADHGPFVTVAIVAGELVGGVLVGLLVGRGGAWVMRRAALPSSGLYPLAVMTLTFLAYGVAAGVHASDMVNAWRNIVRVSSHHHAMAGIILAAGNVAQSRSKDGHKPKPFPEPVQLERVNATTPKVLLAELDGAIRENNQLRACALTHRYGALGHPQRALLDLLIQYGTSEDGRLHAEKYYRTANEEFATTRAAFRWRQMVSLARVTASCYGFTVNDKRGQGTGHRAPGYEEAKRLLKV